MKGYILKQCTTLKGLKSLYLFILAKYPVALAVEDVDGTAVVLLQRSSNHHIIVGVTIEVRHGRHSRAKAGILTLVLNLQ